mgnify:CR=1 FL=1
MHEKILPNLLVKGGDYIKKNVVGKKIVENNGGKVVIVKYLRGYSSTDIIKKQKNYT